MRRKTVSRIGRRLFSQIVGSLALLIGLGISGCATTWRPIADTPRVALTPSKGEITMAARPGKPIGDLVPVDVGVANGTDEPYRIEPDQVFAINEQGQRIMPIPADQAIVVAGNANALKAGLVGAGKSALVGGLAGAASGAAIGAAVGMILASPAQGALIGAAMGGSVGAAGGGIFGGLQGQAAAHHDAENQISSLSLQPRDANPNYSVNGYVFFPKGTYTSVQMNLLNEETHQSETRSSSWDGVPAPPAPSNRSVIGTTPGPTRSSEQNAPAPTPPEPLLPPMHTE